MNKKNCSFHFDTILVLVCLNTMAVLGQGTLIGPSTLNGGFEDGVLTPWGGHITTMQDPIFASQGSWFGRVQSSEALSLLAIQNLTPNPNLGLRFLLTFDARIGAPGYDSVSTKMSGRTEAGLPLSASITPLITPPLTATSWQSYQYQLQMPASWDNFGVTFSISFSKDVPLGGVTHYGYLDNVVLQQIPEPSALALWLTSGILATNQIIRRRKT